MKWILLALMLLPMSAYSASGRNCPTTVIIQSFDSKGGQYFDGIVQEGFASVLRQKFGNRVNVVPHNEFVKKINDEAKRQSDLSTKCSPFIYPRWSDYPKECNFSQELWDEIQRQFDDFLITGRLQGFGHAATFNASLIIGSTGSVISRDTRSYKDVDQVDFNAFEKTMRGDIAVAANKFADAMMKHFYCVEVDPREKKIDFDNPEERKVPITAHVTQLTGDDASGLSVEFSNRSPCCGDISDHTVQLSSGKAKTTYTMTKKVEKDEVHAVVDPDGGITTEAISFISTKEKSLCLDFKGVSTMTLREPESGTSFKHQYTNSGQIPLKINSETGSITGQGTMSQSITADLSSVRLPTSGFGKTPSQKGNPITVSGSVVADKVLKLHLKSEAGNTFGFHSQVEGHALPTQQFANPGFEIDIAITKEEGATKTESDRKTPYPGITYDYTYDFTLKVCPEK